LSESHCAGATLDVTVERMLYAKICDVLNVILFRELTRVCKIRGKNS
jgi:hypothetical protein